MKRYLGWFTLILAALFLTGCVYQTNRNKATSDYTVETWQRHVEVNPTPWAAGASDWFKTGGANGTQEVNKDEPVSAAMTTMEVKVPETFTHVRVNGRFKVEIYGTQDANSLHVYGANDAARHVRVKVSSDMLVIEEAEDAPRDVSKVIVRIGVHNLRSLEQFGCGQIEARYIHSNFLCVTSRGSGNVYLGGIFNLTRVVSSGSGNVSLFGAVTPKVDIFTSGNGSVNISGNVGVHNITHHGNGNVNIIGANSRDAVVRADGHGKISINGQIGVREIDARDKVCVFIYYINSDILNVHTTDKAHVGIAGCVRAMNVDAMRASRFDGRHLFASDVYVRAYDAAHVNVVGTNKLFAQAAGNSSVYVYSSPADMTQFTRDHGVILAIANCERYACGYCPYFKGRVYKD